MGGDCLSCVVVVGVVGVEVQVPCRSDHQGDSRRHRLAVLSVASRQVGGGYTYYLCITYKQTHTSDIARDRLSRRRVLVRGYIVTVRT